LRPLGSPIIAVKVADQENDGMPQILQLAQFVEHHRVPKMDVRRGRVQAELAAQGGAAGFRARQFGDQLGLDQQFVAAALDARQGRDARRGR
jgi:hypothetical protein